MKEGDINFLFTALIHLISLKGEALGGEGRKALRDPEWLFNYSHFLLRNELMLAVSSHRCHADRGGAGCTETPPANYSWIIWARILITEKTHALTCWIHCD
ncbi:hypothetical protein QQF64_019301 [Cirrhinus molitorella]|uniref:Uncharacterized protein n=1 Tax=Cirrhinus molitorella TaxID=172907 RepID=A0ABR3LGF8_9TELE